MNIPFSIAVTSLEISLLSTALELAKKNALPYINYFEKENFDYVLALRSTGLYLEDVKKGLGSLKIDFLQGKLAYRLRYLQNQKQLLAKAIGLKPNFKPVVLDATAGFGCDSFVLAQLGCPVTLLERSSTIFLLLEDALKRALNHPKFLPLSIKLIKTDALIYLKQISLCMHPSPEIIYLDPMYPHSNKSALAKKEIRFLRLLVGDDNDASSLLKLAITYAKQRVVVKRPRLSGYLADIKPHHSLLGKQHRLDVYI
ncbi:MAG: class I SAM-dependent methyltransferase [Candidatus Rickettsiella isopodorum]|jgi:16S rRNA (guanine1516-N2)-methyltransferase|nr:class I SAM-dependent methyltransferase [Gammaproteobacteria bacterium]MCH9754719.1 class I SAM-dependent methyltransferase [Gammaproteobacteria bacterium]MDD5161581.1 class I SAM-dependent methyltransferase [Candidatus Rickettsiella isopodorum]MDQ5900022.1 Ribosomal small subunit methyltransferase [Pseudomonadota bacterium]